MNDTLNVSEYLKSNNINISKKILFVICGLISTLVVLWFSIVNSTDDLLFLLPMIYTFAYTLFMPSVSRMGFGYKVLNIVWSIRYCIVPVLVVISSNEGSYNPDDMLYANILIVIEMLVTFFSVRFFYIKFKKQEAISNNYRKNKLNNLSFNIVFLFILLSLIVLFFDNGAFQQFNFIFQENYSTSESSNLGASILVLDWTKKIVTLYLIGKFGKLYSKKPRFIYVIFSIVLTLTSISIFIGQSRNGVLLEALAYIFVLTNIYPRHKRKITFVLLSVLIFVITSITIFRFFDSTSFNEFLNIFDLNSVLSNLNLYFAGTLNMARGIDTLNSFRTSYNIQTIFKDLFANVIVLNNFVADVPGTVQFFNYSIYNHTNWADQISPTITQALGLFNIFGVLVPVILMYIIVKADFYAKNTMNIFQMFIATLIATTFAFYSPGNITILTTTFINNLFPLILINKFSGENLS